MAELTVRQQEVLEFIRQQQRKTGFSPSSREIQA
ncbi:MAG: repressor LexA, partial [Verrucomicrobia bacterium]|nr:repressor LexA [Verrucomicrobiota bacterium]